MTIICQTFTFEGYMGPSKQMQSLPSRRFLLLNFDKTLALGSSPRTGGNTAIHSPWNSQRIFSPKANLRVPLTEKTFDFHALACEFSVLCLAIKWEGKS